MKQFQSHRWLHTLDKLTREILKANDRDQYQHVLGGLWQAASGLEAMQHEQQYQDLERKGQGKLFEEVRHDG